MAEPEILIRAPRAGDAPGLATLMALPGVRWGTLRLPFETEEAIARRFLSEQPGHHVILAERAGVLVGCAALIRHSGRLAHAAEIFVAVHDGHLRKGIGRRLMEALLDLADNWLGLVRLELAVNVDHRAAIALYESLGFTHEGTARASVLRGGRLVDSHWMARLRMPPAPEAGAG